MMPGTAEWCTAGMENKIWGFNINIRIHTRTRKWKASFSSKSFWLHIQLFCKNCVRFQSVELFVAFYDGNSLTWGTKNNIQVALETYNSNVMSIELEGDFSTASMIKFEYSSIDILCMEMLQLESIDKTTSFDLIQVISIFLLYHDSN